MSALDTRLKIMKVDTSEMSEAEKWTAGTGLTFIPEDVDKNEDWYVPAGAGNVLDSEEDVTTEDAPVEETVDEAPKAEELEKEPVVEPEPEAVESEQMEPVVDEDEDPTTYEEEFEAPVEDETIEEAKDADANVELPGSEVAIETVE